MPKPNSTLLAIVLDKSGSMGSIREDTIGGINTLIADQKKLTVDECRLTLAMFSTDYQLVYNNKPIAEVEPLTEKTYAPNGGTALLDATGKTINDVGAALAAMPEDERPSDVVFAICTDGEENSSREFTKAKIGEMIRHQEEKYKWKFLFLGANFDAISEGATMGFAAAGALNYKSSKKGMEVAMRSLSNKVGTYRTTRSVDDLAWTAAERAENENPDAVPDLSLPKVDDLLSKKI